MLAKKCDICGKLYEAYGKASENERGANGFMFVTVKSNGTDYYGGRIKDLCPECMDALRAFMRERGWRDE